MKKKIKQFLLDVEMAVKSPLIRQAAVRYYGGILIGYTIRRVNEINNYKSWAAFGSGGSIFLTGIVVLNAVNDAFDAVLEKRDEEFSDEWFQKQKELDKEFPTER